MREDAQCLEAPTQQLLREIEEVGPSKRHGPGRTATRHRLHCHSSVTSRSSGAPALSVLHAVRAALPYELLPKHPHPQMQEHPAVHAWDKPAVASAAVISTWATPRLMCTTVSQHELCLPAVRRGHLQGLSGGAESAEELLANWGQAPTQADRGVGGPRADRQ